MEEAFLSVEDKRQQYCMKVLAYGHPNDNKQKITISKLAKLLECSTRTIYRNMGNQLKLEKELLNTDSPPLHV